MVSQFDPQRRQGYLWPDGPHACDVLTDDLLADRCAHAGGKSLRWPIKGLVQDVGITASTTQMAIPAAYRYTGEPDSTTEVQRSNDAGLTWPAVGTHSQACGAVGGQSGQRRRGSGSDRHEPMAQRR